MTSPSIETDLGQLLERIDQRLERIEDRLGKLEVGQARLEEKMTAVQGEISDLKSTTKSQLWSLIVLLGGTLLGIGAKVFLFPSSSP